MPFRSERDHEALADSWAKRNAAKNWCDFRLESRSAGRWD
jgi:hypothetical protein